jgi:hypothetical protein
LEVALERPVRLPYLCLERAWIDIDQGISLIHDLTFYVVNRGHESAHLGRNGCGVDRRDCPNRIEVYPNAAFFRHGCGNSYYLRVRKPRRLSRRPEAFVTFHEEVGHDRQSDQSPDQSTMPPARWLRCTRVPRDRSGLPGLRSLQGSLSVFH